MTEIFLFLKEIDIVVKGLFYDMLLFIITDIYI